MNVVEFIQNNGPLLLHQAISNLAGLDPKNQTRPALAASDASESIWLAVRGGWLWVDQDGFVDLRTSAKEAFSGMECECCGVMTATGELNRMNPPPFDELICCAVCVDDTDQMKTYVRGYQKALEVAGLGSCG